MNRHVKTVLGLVLSVALLGWAMRDVSPAEVAHELASADPLLFLLSILVTIAGLGVRALRWGVLLRPVAPDVSFRPRFAAVVVGFAVNNLIPARVGEVARALTLSRVTRVSVGSSVATLVVERIFDAIALVALLFAAMASPSFPAFREIAGVDPRAAARVVALIMSVGILGLFALVAAPAASLRFAERVLGWMLPARFQRSLLSALDAFVAGLAVLRSPSLFVASLVLAFGQWLFTAGSFVLAFRAFGIHEVPFAGAVFLQSLIALAVAIPSSPGFFGPFEAAAKLGLALWAVAPDKAVSFAVGYHLSGFVPVTLMGFYYLWRLNLRWDQVQGDGETAAGGTATRSVPPPGTMLSESA